MQEPLPKHFKMPQLEMYDRTTNPLDHLESFKFIDAFFGATNEILCPTFRSTLQKSTQYQYSILKLGSIHSFYWQGWSFVFHIASSRRLNQSFNFLIHIKQRNGEPLSSYTSRFNKAALEVYNLDHSIVMTALKSGIQQYPFVFCLEKGSVIDFSKMLTKVEKYACVEEGYGTMFSQQSLPPH